MGLIPFDVDMDAFLLDAIRKKYAQAEQLGIELPLKNGPRFLYKEYGSEAKASLNYIS